MTTQDAAEPWRPVVFTTRETVELAQQAGVVSPKMVYVVSRDEALVVFAERNGRLEDLVRFEHANPQEVADWLRALADVVERLPGASHHHRTSRTAPIGVTMSLSNRDQITAAAARRGLSRSVWMREVLLAAVSDPANAAPSTPASPRGADRAGQESLVAGMVVHVSAAERTKIRARAEDDGVPVAAWARSQLVRHLQDRSD
jgi:hypothetical protein